MKKKLTNNIGLKIISLIAAFLLWLVVLNIEDPSRSQTFSGIPVTFTNTGVLTEKGLVYEVEDGSDVIRSITVTGPRSYIEQLNDSDIVATADFNKMTDDNTIPIELSSNRFSDKITRIKGSITNVKLTVEKEKTVRLVLKVNDVGEVAEGYILGSMTPDQNQIIISGAESVVDSISKAVAEVDVTDATANIATYADVILLDSEGREVESDSLVQKVTSVRVSVEVLTTKRVPLSFSTTGTPADGYAVTGVIDSNPSLITVAGTASTLNSLSRIEIPEQELNVTGQSKDMSATLDISNYLPTGITLADSEFNGKVTVLVYIEPTTVKNVILKGENVTLSKELDGFTVTIEDLNDRTAVKLEGLDENLSAVSSEDFSAYVDLDAALKELDMNQWKEGTYTVPLTFELPEGVTTDDVIEAKILLKAIK